MVSQVGWPQAHLQSAAINISHKSADWISVSKLLQYLASALTLWWQKWHLPWKRNQMWYWQKHLSVAVHTLNAPLTHQHQQHPWSAMHGLVARLAHWCEQMTNNWLLCTPHDSECQHIIFSIDQYPTKAALHIGTSSPSWPPWTTVYGQFCLLNPALHPSNHQQTTGVFLCAAVFGALLA